MKHIKAQRKTFIKSFGMLVIVVIFVATFSGNVYGYYQIMTLGELLKQSDLVVYGRITQREYIYEQSENNNDILMFTDYYIEPISILRGNPVSEDEVILRKMGGETKNQNIICGAVEKLNIGEEYLLFLYRQKGEQYYILGMNQGIFEVSEKYLLYLPVGMVPAKFYGMYNYVVLDYQTLITETQKVNRDFILFNH